MSADRPPAPPPLPPRKSAIASSSTSLGDPILPTNAPAQSASITSPPTSSSAGPTAFDVKGAETEIPRSPPPLPARRADEILSTSDPIPSYPQTSAEYAAPATNTSSSSSPVPAPAPAPAPAPPLPRRKSPAPPPPLSIQTDASATQQDQQHLREQDEETPLATSRPPDTGVTVAITPATPPQSDGGSEPNTPSFGQSADRLQDTTEPPQHVSTTETGKVTGFLNASDTRQDVSTQQTASIPPTFSSSSSSNQQVRQQPPPLPPRRSKATAAAAATAPSLAWIAYTSFLVILAYFHVSVTSLALAALAGWIAVKRVEVSAENVLNEEKRKDHQSRVGEGGSSDAVEWVNHALYALFPLISTDVLTPFVDLMEDALMGQVPPIVTSVRLTSPALGSQPVVLTSLRPMSDQEWFSSLSTVDKRSVAMMDASHNSKFKRAKPSGKSTSSPFKGKHTRDISIGSVKPGGAGATDSPGGMSRSFSASSTVSGSGSGVENVAQEAQRRRKRDRILQKVSRRRQSGEGTEPADDHGGNSLSQDVPRKGLGPRGPEDGVAADQVQDGERQAGGDGENDMDEDDPNAGQYVNYQIGFEYKRDHDAERKGRGLHCLAYFGWGVKGIGKSEIPVYIDVLSIKGTVNVRLLLSATPPFVRTGTFSFPSLPEYDVSAQPLKKGAFNAMELPGMKQYVKQSIMEVASAFVRPNSYTLDLDRLLLGRESSLRTVHIGVLHIFINRAEELPKVDTMGSCDPYVSISLSKYHKPVFSTRTIRDTRDPVWDEEAFVLVASDAIEAGEKLRLRASDSDRFSADDALGVVEVDLADLIDTHADRMYHRVDPLTADRPGMRSSGFLDWSVQFHPLWQMPQEETQAKILEARTQRNRDCEPPEDCTPWWLDMVDKLIDGKEEKWVKERQEKRKETMAWFTGEKERDEIEAGTKPSEDIRSGILQFHIHQCIDLEVEPTNGTYSSHTSSARSAAGGKPALASLIDRTPTENPDPPSAYTEVHLNDKLVYRTRTKQVTPLPYFNAVSERFVRDWTKGKVVFVVRDERNREHDPILGMVVIPLREAFKTRSQFTRWFPLVGGLGWGRIRISLLWKPVDMSLSHGLSGYEASTLRLRSFSFSSLGIGLGTDKSISVLLHTDADKYELRAGDVDEPGSTTSNNGRPRSGTGSTSEEIEMEFDLSPRHVRLAMMYRHSCSLVITFITRSSVLKKKKVLGVGVVRLAQMDDGEGEARVGIYGTTDVEKVLRAEQRSSEAEPKLNTEDDRRDAGQLHEPSTNSSRDRSKSISARSSRSSLSLRSSRAHTRREASDDDQSSSPAAADSIPLLGYANLRWNIIPGIGKVHRKIAKRDLRFAKVYEAWEGCKEDDAQRKGKSKSKDKGKGKDTPDRDRQEILFGDIVDSEDEYEKKVSERRAHSHALHKRHKGVFQLKIARTGRFVKDKIGAKLYSAANNGNGNKSDGRYRGSDLAVEKEGISRM
ncbi:hypothetical protein I316_06139 [Kwoniella heveanensis BCC8398]|uniref:C2 domain-containing protein n=1 Tax=Kwoniella heveanensis BCC8398 TaxID=1296120 RepID=A0A1B9GMY5_9TREE|nr:hypothetical protein I316_06139 [Kwoniella heveanensis BCC8398]